MTSFTLFKPHQIDEKLRQMRSQKEAEAFMAAIFSFSARFHSCHKVTERPEYCKPPSYFADIAMKRFDECLNECGDSVPPFHLLQACILLSFFWMTISVGSKSWRLLGTCIRFAYEMNLHLIDANSEWSMNVGDQGMSIETWSNLEERRRAWWALWEMDVYSSTIRRLPLAISWAHNLTFLPIPDDCWLSNTYQTSCYLSNDPNVRWKDLSKTGNCSSKAWFIVINSLKRNAQSIIYNSQSLNISPQENLADLKIILNSLYCATTSLPPTLVYQGDSLDFHTKASPDDISHHQYHSDIYAIHLISQLTRFMIHHREVCAQAPWINKSPSSAAFTPAEQDPANQLPWKNYMKAAEEIVTIVRNSASNHHQYVNPFLVNTLWFAASAQVACRVFGPSCLNRSLATSNFELLSLIIDRVINFWHAMGSLKVRLLRLEAKLKTLEMNVSDGGVGQEANLDTVRQYSAVNNSNLTHATAWVGVLPDPPMPDVFEWFDSGALDLYPTTLEGYIDPCLP